MIVIVFLWLVTGGLGAMLVGDSIKKYSYDKIDYQFAIALAIIAGPIALLHGFLFFLMDALSGDK
jgi:hypothetical protein